MPRKKSKKPTDDEPSTENVRSKIFAQATGTENSQLQLQRLNSVLQSFWLAGAADDETQNDVITGILASLRKLAPRDEIEGMLTAQMVATHNTAMECLRRAMLREQTFEGRQENLKYAAKFLALYTRQIETLDKHRGKGQQKITVEHVNVHSGGQAIVGNVEAKSDKPKADPVQSPALENKPSPTIETTINQSAREKPGTKAGKKR